jgi:hypothetical protein
MHHGLAASRGRSISTVWRTPETAACVAAGGGMMMSDNVVDMWTRRQRIRGEDQAAVREKAKAERLEAAPDIAARLRSTPRTASGDRAIFTANLARMCVEASMHDKSSFSQLFETAFGKDFEAKYKKRKRFICSRDEQPPSEGFAAHGADFVDLAEATAKIAHAGQPENAIQQAKHRAILRLIEGSSFDDNRPPEARLKDEAVAALLRWFDHIVLKVETEVDLDAMRALIEHDTVSAIVDGNGNVQDLVSTETGEDSYPNRQKGESIEAYETRRTDAWVARKHPAERALLGLLREKPNGKKIDNGNKILAALSHLALKEPNTEPVGIFEGDFDDPGFSSATASDTSSPFAPRVVLGEIHSPLDIEGAVMLDIDEAEIEATLAEQEGDYMAVIARHRLADLAPAFDRALAHRHILKNAALKGLALRFGYSEAWISDECASFYDLDQKVKNDDFEPPEDPWTRGQTAGLIARRHIELKLLRDHATERWRLCLALSHGVRLGIYGREGVYGTKRYGEPFQPSMCLGFYDVGLSPTAEMVALYLHRVERSRFMLYAVANDDLSKGDVWGIGMGWLSVPSEESLDALFAPIAGSEIGDHRVQAPFDRFWTKPAPAQPNTLAGMILRNLAYASDDDRYDLLLLEDARCKVSMASEFSKRRKEEFESAINRLKF